MSNVEYDPFSNDINSQTSQQTSQTNNTTQNNNGSTSSSSTSSSSSSGSTTSSSGSGTSSTNSSTSSSGEGDNSPTNVLSNASSYSNLSDQVPTISQSDVNQGLINNNNKMLSGNLSQTAKTVDNTDTASTVDPRDAVGYDAAKSQQAVEDAAMTAATGTVSDQAIIDPNQYTIDTEATAAGTNALGQALNSAAILDLNDVDARATVRGQIGILQNDFFDKDGNPQIPSWATGLARSVGKIAAFKGVTGTAAVGMMSNALLEASVGIAEQDAKFYQTVTLTNLNNEQQATIQKAAVLANLEMANLDARMTAAVQNSKNFMAMDLANLDNEQQARLINTQSRVQAILEDTKAENVARAFLAQNQNDLNKFYDELNSQIEMFNANQTNSMKQFNAGQVNDMRQFNAALKDSRQKFNKTMAYNIDAANAKWRQEVIQTNTQMKYDAAKTDVQNTYNLTKEALNRIWDRTDSLLDYTWKSTENQRDRAAALVIAKLQASTSKSIADSQEKAANKAGWGQVFGTIAGKVVAKFLEG